VPALNDLLAPFGVAFGDAILEGQFAVDGEKLVYASGANVVRFPAGGHLHSAELADKATAGAPLLCPYPTTSPSFLFSLHSLAPALTRRPSMSHQCVIAPYTYSTLQGWGLRLGELLGGGGARMHAGLGLTERHAGAYRLRENLS